jgi:hypothetical protein
MKIDHFAEAGAVLAGAFKETDALLRLAAAYDPHQASKHAYRLREALLVALLALGEARRAHRRCRPPGSLAVRSS